MKKPIFISRFLFMLLLISLTIPTTAQEKGLESIQAEDMKFHLKFLSADEFRGRNTPSLELKIASRYIALMAEHIGLQPLMPDGSYYQPIPLEVTKVSEAKTHIRLTGSLSDRTYYFPQAFGVRGRYLAPGSASGEVVFLGLGIHAPELGWDDYEDKDLKGKIAVILDVQLPENHVLKPQENHRLFRVRNRLARQKGAEAVLNVIDIERENKFIQKGLYFDNPERCRLKDTETVYPSTPSSALNQIEIRHETAAALLGISQAELRSMYDKIKQGTQPVSINLEKNHLDIDIAFSIRSGHTYNVVGYLEGTDPILKNEFVLFGSHHDGIGMREDIIFNGADDNISGVVAMFELAEAMQIERPRRSVIFVWHTGEEKGLYGASYFVAHSPVPVKSMSAELNMDMLCRNDPNSIYLIGSNKLSSELDAAIQAMNDRYTHLNLDYKYEDPSHPDRFFFRSDQYPYIRYGVPGVWFFCGTTEDYHRGTDTAEKADYQKMVKVTKLVYLTAMAIGNQDQILKLDLHPEITTRGEHNTKINWRKALETRNR